MHPRSLILFALFASSAYAQDIIYRGTDANGTVVYSNSSKGLKAAKKIIIDEPVISGSNYGSLSVDPLPLPPSLPPSSSGSPKTESNSSGTTPASAYEAEQQYKAAQFAAESGKEPLAGERLGTAGGSTRLAPSYFERQDKLARAVTASREALLSTQLTQ